jgi:hypothetical protein
MVEKPKEREKEDIQKKEERSRLWREVAEFLSENPTLAVTASYVYLTAVGLLYSASLYFWFGINILDYSEVADFLLGAFKNPYALLVGLGQAVVGAFVVVRYVSQGEVLSRNDLQVGEFMRKRALILSIGIIVYLVIIPIIFASWAAYDVKDGQKEKVEVRYRSFKGSADQVTVPGLELIGATQKTFFFYDPDEKRTIVIPQAQLVSIEIPD